MANPGLSKEKMLEAIEMVQHHGSVGLAARATGMAYSTLEKQYKLGLRAAERGEFGTDPVIPGFRIAQVTSGPRGESIVQRPALRTESDVPSTMRLKKLSLQKTPAGEILRWEKYSDNEFDPAVLIDSLVEAFKDTPARPAIATPKAVEKQMLAVYPLIDWHVGLMAWSRETGENYDLKIARETIMPAMRRLIAATPPAEEAVVLGIGDLLHFDGFVHETPASGHPLDADGRYPKVLETAADMVEETVELVLARHKRVTLRILRGNHDPVSAVAVAMAMKRVFRSNKRITVDVDQSYTWWFRRGKVFLGGSHGDKAKMKDLPMVMAHDRPDDWAASSYRRIYTGHLHNERRIEEGGVIVTTMRSPVAKDAYHSFNKWRSGRSVYSETFNIDGSEAASLTFNL